MQEDSHFVVNKSVQAKVTEEGREDACPEEEERDLQQECEIKKNKSTIHSLIPVW